MWGFLGGLASGAAQYFGGQEQRAMTEQQYQQNRADTSDFYQRSQTFNATEAEKAREFSARQAAEARAFNAQQGDLAWQRDIDMQNRTYGAASTMMDTSHAFNREEAMRARQFSAEQGYLQREYNTKEAEAARQFTERMSSTAYQRAMTDMRKAGLNPILAYTQGGASTPNAGPASAGVVSGPAASGAGGSPGGGRGSAVTGPMASGVSASSGMQSGVSPPQWNNLYSGVANSALEVMKALPQIDILHQTERNLKEEEHRIMAESARTTADKLVKQAQEAMIKEQTRQLSRGAVSGELGSDFLRTKVGQWANWLGNIGREINPFTSSAKSINQMVNPN